MNQKSLLLSIKPRFADAIFAGTKRFELRRVRPKVMPGDLVLVYVTVPRAAIEGAFEVSEMIEESTSKLWETVKSSAGVTKEEFDNYFEGKSQGYAIGIQKTWPLAESVSLAHLRKRSIQPPQSYRYLDSKQTAKLLI